MPPARCSMKNRFLMLVYAILFSLLAFTAITQYTEKGFSVIWMSLALGAFYLLPAVLERIFGISIPTLLKYAVLAFLFLCLYVGGILSFYNRYNGWDSFIHLISGFIMPALALSLINLINGDPNTLKMLKPGFIFVFMVLFAAGISLLWEYVEFLSDSLLGTNHLNDTLLNNGQVDIGLIDTMKDLLCSQLTSLVTSFWFYRAIRKGRWLGLSRILIAKNRH